jgi:xanthine dehydrogenase YagS FAD-binding subunit
MKTFVNTNVRTVPEAVTRAQQARQEGRAAAFVGGGSDLLALVKDRIIRPDVLVNLKTVRNLDQVTPSAAGVALGGQITLATLSADRTVRRDYPVLAEAAGSVATPQIRNVGTLAGNVCQRPWCWYYRNGFPCYKAGGNRCFSVVGENQQHAIFGGGPSYIVHPSDTATALVALDATFRLAGPSGERTVKGEEFFVLPRQNAARENVLGDEDLLVSFMLPAMKAGTRSGYFKVLDRQAWTHAVVSVAAVLEMDQRICRRARVVLGGVAPVPWRLPQVEDLLTNQEISQELAARAGEMAVTGARPLAKNAYKIPLTKAAVRRTLLRVAGQA